MTAIADLVLQTSISIGSSNLTLVPLLGKRSFSDAFGAGATTDVFWYFASNSLASEWEVGRGHMSDATTLVRDTVLESSNGGLAVTFSVGVKYISSDLPTTQLSALASAAVGDLLYASAASPAPAWSRLADVATGAVLVSGGVGVAPAWSSSPTIKGTVTITPAAASTARGLDITQSGPNTGAASTSIRYNSIILTEGAAVNSGDSSATPLYIQHTISSASKGQKYGIFVSSLRSVATAGMGDQIGGVFFAQASANAGGTNTSNAAAGTIFACNPNVDLESGATNYLIASAGECDITVRTGASVKHRLGWRIIGIGEVAGADLDAALDISSVGTSAWNAAILLNGRSPEFGATATISPSGSVIKSDGTAQAINSFVSLPNWTFTGKILDFGDFSVDGATGNQLRLAARVFAFGVVSATTPYNNFYDSAQNAALVLGGGGSAPDASNYYRNTTHVLQSISGGSSFLTAATGATGIKFNQYGAGILHSSAAGVLSSSPVVTADISDANITYAKIQNIAGLSIFGRSGTSAGVGADVTGTADQILRIAGSAASLGFGSIDLSKSAAVGSSVLAGVNGGTGLSTAAVGDIMYASATTPTWARLAGVAVGSVLVSGGVNTAPAWSAAPSLTTSLTVPLIAGGTGAASTLILESTSGAGTTDAIIGKTASQVERFRVTTGGLFNIGPSVTPDSLLTVNGNTGASVAPSFPVAGTAIHLIGADGVNVGLVLDGYNNSVAGAGTAIFDVRVAGGTQASKTALTANLGFNFRMYGWDTAAYSLGAAFQQLATETWTTSARGTKILFKTTTTGATTFNTSLVVSNDGGISVGVDAAPGLGLIYINSASFLMRNKTTWNNGAAAAVGTITNAPTAGNPTKWIPVDDNGTTRYMPAW